MRTMLFVAALAWLGLTASPALATSGEDVTRSHDVRDLLVDIPDFSGGIARAEAAEQPEPRDRAAMLDQLLTQIDFALAPDERPTALREEDGKLIATGSAESQAALEALLATLRQARGLQVNVETRLITLDREAAARDLGDDLRAKLALARLAPQPLDQDEKAAVLAMQDAERGEALTAPNVTLLNQQRASVSVESEQYYVADAVPVEGGAAWQPKIASVPFGVRLSVRAAATGDAGAVGAEVTWWVQKLLDMKTVDVAPNAQKQVPVLQTLGSTRLVTAPAGATMILDAVDLAAPEEDKAARGDQLLVVLVTMTPIDQKDTRVHGLQESVEH